MLAGLVEYLSARLFRGHGNHAPEPVDTSQFAVDESRLQVVEVLGAPTASVKQGDQSCDVYKLYTHGPGGVGKGAIAAGEAVADVFTLGLAGSLLRPWKARLAMKTHRDHVPRRQRKIGV